MTSTEKKSCVKCGARNAFIPCDGCQSRFCQKHFTEHRAELTNELRNIDEQGGNLKKMHERHEQRLDHPLFAQIKVWEHDAISKIQLTAQAARDQLRQVLKASTDRIKTLLIQLKVEVDTKREHDDFLESDLLQLNEQLKNIRKQLETPSDIALAQDDTSPPIHLIKLNRAEETYVGDIPSPAAPAVKIDEDPDCLSEKDIEPGPATKDDGSSTSKKEAKKTSPLTAEPLHLPIFMLDPKKNQTLLLLNPSTAIESSKLAIDLRYFLDDGLLIFNNQDEYFSELKQREQVTVVFDQFSAPIQQELLHRLSVFDCVHSTYIVGNPPEKDKDRLEFCKHNTSIRAMHDNEERLVVQWVMDSAGAYKNSGDVWVKRGDQERAKECFERGIRFYRQLANFMRERQRGH